ncbi:hypothetical protein CYY_006578 [Polysphondylium violaceum]|uniref:J domain-containing protein n=1 Tax=Polysphondylium violaceum TaxID=133409 RepID=A0A8J4V5S6_9MYCE|nr:hypothetical protein CYY_006578 [Polysphondylium violaceum]
MNPLHAPPRHEEITEIMSATFNGEANLYLIMEIADEEVSIEQIKKQYRDLARRYHPDKNPNATEQDRERMSMIVPAYKVLSNERLRYLYDTYKFSAKESRRTGANKRMVLYELFTLGLSVASFPFHNLDTICKARPRVKGGLSDSPWRVFRERGLYSLYRGTVFTTLTDFVHSLIEKRLQGTYLAPIGIGKVLGYPATLISNLIVMNPSLTLGALVPALLRGAKDKEFDFKNLWYGYSIYALTVGVDLGLNYIFNKIREKSFEKYIKNPQSKLWRYISYVSSYQLFTSGIPTLLLCPFDVVLYQYQYRLLGVVQSGATVASLGALSLKNTVLSIYQTQGLSKFFSGLVPSLVYRFIADYAFEEGERLDDEYDENPEEYQ